MRDFRRRAPITPESFGASPLPARSRPDFRPLAATNPRIRESEQISDAIYVIIIGLARTPPPSGPDKVRLNE
jgi:hypothetical protein